MTTTRSCPKARTRSLELPSRARTRTQPNKAFDRVGLALALAGSTDLLVKRLVASHLAVGERVTLVPSVLALTFVRNGRGAMGLFGNRPVLLAGFALVIIAALTVALYGALRTSPATQTGYGLVVGGALANVVDRVAHGYVVDYIAVPQFYVFNLADAFVSCGLVLIAIPALRGKTSA